MNEQNDLAALCFNFSVKRYTELVENKRLVAHYTTSENGLKLLNSKTFWLRNSALMNDFSEIEHGHRCLDYALGSGGLHDRLSAVLNRAHPGLWPQILARLAKQRVNSDQHVYLTSLSETEANDDLGKLSMWRAYGGRGGVAIIFKTKVFETENDLGFYNSPVLYADEFEFALEFTKVVDRLENAVELLSRIDRLVVEQIVGNALQFATLSTKHPGFAEEREWRVIYTARDTPSKWIEFEAVTLSGQPQIVCKIPLRNQDGMNMPEMELTELIKKIIIGPCAFPQQTHLAYMKTLSELGFADPSAILRVSNIPLRH